MNDDEVNRILKEIDPRLNGVVIPTAGRIQVDARALALLHAKLETIRNDTLEECVQLCLLQRDKFDNKEYSDVSGPAWNMGAAFSLNLVTKKIAAIRAMKRTTG